MAQCPAPSFKMTEVYLDLPVCSEFTDTPFSLTFNHLREKQCCHFLKGTSPHLIVTPTMCDMLFRSSLWKIFFLPFTFWDTVLTHLITSDITTERSLASVFCAPLGLWLNTEPSHPAQGGHSGGHQRPGTRLSQNDYLRALWLDLGSVYSWRIFLRKMYFIYFSF